MMTTVNAFLTLLAWGIVCGLIIVLYRIAQFYEISSGRRSNYSLFFVPLILFALGAVLYAVLGRTANVWGDACMLLGGLSLIGLGFHLLQLMTGSRS